MGTWLVWPGLFQGILHNQKGLSSGHRARAIVRPGFPDGAREKLFVALICTMLSIVRTYTAVSFYFFSSSVFFYFGQHFFKGFGQMWARTLSLAHRPCLVLNRGTIKWHPGHEVLRTDVFNK